MSAKDSEIEQLQAQLGAANEEIAKLKAELEAERSRPATQAAPAPAPPPAPPPPAASASAPSNETLEEALERANRAEAEALENKAALVKVTAKLNAVSTLYTEAAQREAVLRLELEQSANAAKEALYD